MLVKRKVPVMLVGPAGCGKTQLVFGLLHGINPEETLFTNINMNFFTTSALMQENLESGIN